MSRRAHLRRTFASSGLVVALSQGCGLVDGALRKPSPGVGVDQNGGQSGDGRIANGAGGDLVSYPSRQFYEALLLRSYDLMDRDQLVGEIVAPQTVWLNFDGGTVARGYGSGQSPLVCSSAAVIPPLPVIEADRIEVARKVGEHFAKVGVSLAVSHTRPQFGNATSIFIGGSALDLGCPDGRGRSAAALIDPGHLSKNDVGFVFESAATSVDSLALTITHVLGHTFGLDHTTNMSDLMYAGNLDSKAAFGVSPLSAGNAVQDAPGILRYVLGTPMAGANGVMPSGLGGQALFLPGVGFVNLGASPVLSADILAGLVQLTNSLDPSSVLDLTALMPRLKSLFPPSSIQTSLAGLERPITVLALITRAASNMSPQNFAGLRDEIQQFEGEPGSLPPSPSPVPAPTVPALPGPSAFIDAELIVRLVRAEGSGNLSLDKLAAKAGYASVGAAVRAIQSSLNEGRLTIPQDQPFSNLAPLFGLGNGTVTVVQGFHSFWSSVFYARSVSTGLNLIGIQGVLKVAYLQGLQWILGPSLR